MKVKPCPKPKPETQPWWVVARQEALKALKASQPAIDALNKREKAIEKKIGRKALERLLAPLKKSHRAFCLKRFGKEILAQTSVGWFTSYTRIESKHYNGFVTISEIDEQRKVTHTVVPYH